jgi:MFS family permease
MSNNKEKNTEKNIEKNIENDKLNGETIVDKISNNISYFNNKTSNFLHKGKNSKIITIIALIIFVILFSTFLYYDPYSILHTNYFYIFIIIAIIIYCFLILLITFFSFVSYDETIGKYVDKERNIISLFNILFLPFVIFFSFIFVLIVIFLIYKYKIDVSLYFPNMSSYYSLTYIIWILIFAFFLFFLLKGKSFELKDYYKNFVEKNLNNQSATAKIIDFIKNIGLIIYFSFKKMFNDETGKENKKYVVYLIIIIVLYILYFCINTFINSFLIYSADAKYVLKDFSSIDKQSILASYQKLNDIKINGPNVALSDFNYQYSVSFWFIIRSRGPDTSTNYSRFVPIFNYGYKPCVMYNVKEGTLRVVVKHKNVDLVSNDNNNTNNDIDKTIYSDSNVKMQTWNNIIINYVGGTMDVFLNGNLVSSTPNVVNYMRYDNMTIGSDDGIRGRIKDVIYFKKPLNGAFIYYLYNIQRNTFDFSNFKTDD